MFDINDVSINLVLCALACPIISIIPVLGIYLYQRFHLKSINRKNLVLSYLSFLYITLAFVAFTLFPFPDDMEHYCSTHNIKPNFDIMMIVNDIKFNPLLAYSQAILNIIFFMPIGVFAKKVFDLNLLKSLFAGFALSTLIEVSQLTAMFGYFPCTFRTFDTNDIILNTLGAVLGYLAYVLQLKIRRWLTSK
jgi:glycopeptide antibiotics resistance protein